MCNLNEVIGTHLSKMLDDTEKDMSAKNPIRDEKRIVEKLELYFSLKKEIDEKLA